MQLLQLELASLAICFVTFWIGSVFLVESNTCHDGTYFGCQLAVVLVIGMNIAGVTYIVSVYMGQKMVEMKDTMAKIRNYKCLKYCTCCIGSKIMQRRRDSMYELVDTDVVMKKETDIEYQEL